MFEHDNLSFFPTGGHMLLYMIDDLICHDFTLESITDAPMAHDAIGFTHLVLERFASSSALASDLL